MLWDVSAASVFLYYKEIIAVFFFRTIPRGNFHDERETHLWKLLFMLTWLEHLGDGEAHLWPCLWRLIPERERSVLHVGGTTLWARDLAGVEDRREEAKGAPTFPSLLPGPPCCELNPLPMPFPPWRMELSESIPELSFPPSNYFCWVFLVTAMWKVTREVGSLV